MPQTFLKQALDLAASRRGFCAPNPAVGAVIVRNGEVLATGYHAGCGHAHAEVMALDSLTSSAEEATLYCTLEPCCHQGRTPPCTDRIIKEGITKVIFAYQDPNPIVAGQGAQKLCEAGIECTQLELPDIAEFYRSYQYWFRTKRPFVTAKLALSIDGKIAGPGSTPVLITSSECQEFTHQKRREADAILTTARTVLIDDPQLNVRLADETISKPLYVLDRQCQLTGNEQIFNTSSSVTIFYDASMSPHLNKPKVEFAPVNAANNELKLDEIIEYVGNAGVHDLWVEAGGRFFNALVQANLVQRGLLYVAPKILGPDAVVGFPNNDNIFSTTTRVKWYNRGPDSICELEW